MPEKRIDNRIRLISTAMCTSFAFVVVSLILTSNIWNSGITVFHIAAEATCMAVTLVMYMWHLRRKNDRDKSERLFERMCILIYFALLLDIISWITNGHAELKNITLIFNIVVYILIYIHGAIYSEYIFSYLDQDSEPIQNLKKMIRIILIVSGIARLILIFTGSYFYVDGNGVFHNGKLFALGFIVLPVISVFICGAAAGTGISMRRLLSLLSYPISILCMLGIALLNVTYCNPLLIITLSTLFIYCSTFLEEEERKDTLNENFQRYLSEDIAGQLTNSGIVEPGGSTIYVSMMFCSLHHFGEVMETMEPEDAVKILNHFYGAVADIIVRNKGTLLEFPGYGVFCIFGAFNDCNNHADAAVRAAYTMQQQMPEINEWNVTNHYPELNMGIGINTGDVVLGNIGSKNHLRYSAISRHVNLASRIENYSGDGEIIIAQTTLDESSVIEDSEKIMTIVPKGIAQPVSVYRLIKIKEDTDIE